MTGRRIGMAILCLTLGASAPGSAQGGDRDGLVRRAAALDTTAATAYALGTEAGILQAIRLWSAQIVLRDSLDDFTSILVLHLNVGSAWNRLESHDSALVALQSGISLASMMNLVDSAIADPLLREYKVEAGIARAWLGQADSAAEAFRGADSLARNVADTTLTATHDWFARLEQEWLPRLINSLDKQNTTSLGRGTSIFRTLLVLAELREDRLAAGRAGMGLGSVFIAAGRADSARHWALWAREAFRDVENYEGVGQAVLLISNANLALGVPDSAAVYQSELAGMSKAMTALSRLLARSAAYGERKPDSALLVETEALALARRNHLRATEQNLLLSLAASYRVLGRTDSSAMVLEEARRLARRRGVSGDEARVLRAMARIDADRGRQDAALAGFEAALERYRTARDRSGRAGALLELGTLQSSLGNYAAARESLVESFQIRSGLADDFATRVAAGEHPLYGADAARMIETVGEAKVKQQEVDWLRLLQGDVFASLIALGDAYESSEEPDSARARLLDAVDLQRRTGLSEDRLVGPLVRLAMLEVKQAARTGTFSNLNTDSARALAHRSLAIARRTRSATSESLALSLISSLYQLSGPAYEARAVAYLDSASFIRQRAAQAITSDAVRLSVTELSVEVFDAWVEQLYREYQRTGTASAAASMLAAAERSRARSLLALLGERVTPAAGGALLAEGQALIQAAVRHNSRILSYHVTGDRLIGWMILPTGEVFVMSSLARASHLGELAVAFRRQLGVERGVQESDSGRRTIPHLERSGSLGATMVDSASDAAAALQSILFPAEMEKLLPPGVELVIVPHGPLALIPFAALSLQGDSVPLGIRVALRFVPSIAVLDALAKRGAARAGAGPDVIRESLLVGNPTMPTVKNQAGMNGTLPPLPGAEAEAAWLSRRFGVPALLGARATESAVRARLPRARLVHLATHGFAYSSDARSRESFVALGPGDSHDGVLTVGEILDDPRLTLLAELVVLSACQTGLGDLKRSEGTVGLQRAFLARGARAVLVSLWSVSDEATDLLMRRFYSHWLDRPGLNKAEALRRAQADVRATPGFEEPRFWAPFQLVGAP